MDGNLIDLNARDAVKAMKDGDISAEAYAKALLDQADKHKDLNAWCQRRSKIGPWGGAKLGHFGFARDACDGRRPVSRALHVAGG